jgi:hypothetical protein
MTVKDEIHSLIPVLFSECKTFIKWPTVEVWRERINTWSQLPFAVGAIDGTSVKINKPQTEPQRLYFSGHRHFHAVHTQVIVDNYGTCFVECGFLGHLNDAQQYCRLPEIGGPELPFPDECFLLGDKIYPNRHPIVTPFTEQQINRRHVFERRCRELNKIISTHRSIIERSICKLKSYRILSSVWRQRRRHLRQVVIIVAGLVTRRAYS